MPKNSTRLARTLACVFAISASSAHYVFAAPTTHPNVVVILIDDMGYSDLQCYGGEGSPPNISKLAAEGVRFTQFYNTARCSASPAALLTGLYPHQAGLGFLDNMIVPNSKGTQGKLRDDCV